MADFGPGSCKTCNHPDRLEIEREIIAGKPLSIIGPERGLRREGLSRHKNKHLTPAIVAVRNEQVREEVLGATAKERVEALLSKLDDLVNRTHEEKRESMLLAASRELRSAIELAAKLSGELRPENQTQVAVVNLSGSDEWVRFRGAILRALDAHPQAKADVIRALSDSGDSRVDAARRLADRVTDGLSQ